MAGRIRRARILFDGGIALDPGQEWHERVTNLQVGQDLNLTCFGPVWFYAGLYSDEEHNTLRVGLGASRFPFPLASRTSDFTKTYRITVAGDWWVVIRASTQFNRPGHIRVIMELTD
jgi:hypothetical protein